jgi:hypothetical protein
LFWGDVMLGIDRACLPGVWAQFNLLLTTVATVASTQCVQFKHFNKADLSSLISKQRFVTSSDQRYVVF